MRVSKAIDVVARQAMRDAVEAWYMDGWESLFPDVGLYDYERIAEHMEELLPPDVSAQRFRDAYDVLAARAEGVV